MPTIPSKGSVRDAASLVSDPAANDSRKCNRHVNLIFNPFLFFSRNALSDGP